MVKLSVEVKGVEQLKKKLNNNSKQVKNATTVGLTQATFFMEGEVKESIAGRKAEPRSVDTGRFLNSVKGTILGRFMSKIESNVEYAKGLEFGTSRLTPRRHFRNSLSRNRLKIISFIQNKINKIK